MLALLALATLLLPALAIPPFKHQPPFKWGSPNSSTGFGNPNATVYNAFNRPDRTIQATLNVNDKGVPITGVTQGGVDAFLGIPYAAPPVNDLRWKRPQEPVYGDRINATQQPVACMQLLDNVGFNKLQHAPYGVSEDCLTLSVLAPKGTKPNARLPVMVYLYGGRFFQGSGAVYNSPIPVTFSKQIGQPIILVTLNFRGGVFGFPTGQDAAAHGTANLGLYDQLAAFQWIKEHICSFGGDSSRITAFGDSSGAMSLADLMLDTNLDAFQSAILMSGAPGAANTPKPGSWNAEYELLLANAGCEDWDCLTKVDAAKLLNASQVSDALIYTPVQDGELITGQPWDLVREGHVARIPYIAGNTRDEGTHLLPPSMTVDGLRPFLENQTQIPLPQEVWDKILAAYPADAIYPTSGAPNGTGAIGPDGTEVEVTDEFARVATIYGDRTFQSRRRWLLQNTPDIRNAWTYEFEGLVTGLAPVYGISHGADPFYFFGWVGSDPRTPGPQIVLGFQLMAYFINFAYNHDPNPGPPGRGGGGGGKGGGGSRNSAFESSLLSTALPQWPPYTEAKVSLRLNPNDVSRITDDFRPQMSVWNEEDVARANAF